MIILHCIKYEDWNNIKSGEYILHDNIKKDGFIHCSTAENFYNVAPNFKDIKEKMVLLLIDTNQLESVLKWEDGDNSGEKYPHIYGPLNTSAVVDVLDFSLDENNNWVKNKEFLNK